MKYIFLLFLISGSAFANLQPQSVWIPQWSFDPMDDSVSCSIFSTEILFSSNYLSNKAYIGIQDDNTVTIQTRQSVFDSKYISKFAIRAGKNKAIFHPKYISTHLVEFSPEKSKKIIDELLASSSFTIQVAFFPESGTVSHELNTGKNLTAFQIAWRSHNNCKAIKNDEGWAGIAVDNMSTDINYIKFIKNNTKYSNPGVMLWSIHPEKAASKSGLLRYDVILAVNQKPVDMNSMLDSFRKMKSKDSLKLDILRGNSVKEIILTKP